MISIYFTSMAIQVKSKVANGPYDTKGLFMLLKCMAYIGNW